MRPAIAYSAMWAASFAAASTVGVATLAYVTFNEGSMRTLSSADVQQRLAQGKRPAPAVTAPSPADPVLPPAGTGPSSPRPIGGGSLDSNDRKAGDKKKSPSASPSQVDQSRGFQSSGGSLSATCHGSTATLTRWNAAFQFFTENVERGPGLEVGVRFDKLDFGAPDIVVLVTCKDGVPDATESAVPDGDTTGHDHGPGHGSPGGHDHHGPGGHGPGH